MSVTGGQAAGLHIRTLSQTSVYRSLQNVQQRFLPSVRRSPLPVWAISPDGQRPQDLSDGRSPPEIEEIACEGVYIKHMVVYTSIATAVYSYALIVLCCEKHGAPLHFMFEYLDFSHNVCLYM